MCNLCVMYWVQSDRLLDDEICGSTRPWAREREDLAIRRCLRFILLESFGDILRLCNTCNEDDRLMWHCRLSSIVRFECSHGLLTDQL